MASIRHLQRNWVSGEPASRLRAKLTVSELRARAPQLAGIVLAVALAAQALAIALALAGEMSVGSAIHVATGERVSDEHRLALGDITAAHLFGVSPRGAKPMAARVSRSPLVLTGILATNDPHNGLAIVGSSASSARVIQVGSEAAPGTVLIKVYPRWVVLQRGTERLKLRFPHASLGGALAAHRGPLRFESGPAPEMADSGDSAFAVQNPPPRPQLTDDAAVLTSFSLVSTTTIQGEAGMRIAGTAFNRKTLAALGLHSGDVIVQVNGAPIGSPQGDLYRALRSGGATLTVDRQGEDTSVTIDAGSLAGAAELYRQADPDL